MYCIRKYRTADGRIPFDEYFAHLTDVKVRARLLKRLDKAALGNLGDWRAVGDGVCEFREHFNQGHRIYFAFHQRVVILLLFGGSKSTQSRDIKKARQYWLDFKRGEC